MEPYWTSDDGRIVLYHGDCRDITAWLAADVLVTDPPYGRAWSQGDSTARRRGASDKHDGIAGDLDTTTRDTALALWGNRKALVFGDPLVARPVNARQVLVFRKPNNSGTKGTFAGFRRDIELVYVVGPWTAGLNGRSSVLATAIPAQGGPYSPVGKWGHPHAKPIDIMGDLISACPPGIIADPFAGSGSTLVAAQLLGRRAVGVEIYERYCEIAARRLSQGVLFATNGDPPAA